MLREIIKPSSEKYMIQIPKEYIDKEVEILVLPFVYEDNIKTKKVKNKFNPEEFYNASNISKKDIDDYLKSVKEEWNNIV
jgi:hypothetical protein